MKLPIFEKLTHYWPLDEATGTKRRNIVKPTSYLQETLGPITGTTEDGMRAGCAIGAGNILSYLHTLPVQEVSMESPCTIAMWMKYESGWPISAEYLYWHAGSTTNPYAFVDGTGRITIGDGFSGDYLTNLTTLVLDEWNLVVIVRENEMWRLSVNGGAFMDVTVLGILEAGTIRFLGSSVSDFVGKMCEIGIWRCALTQAEVNRLWNDGDGLFPEEFYTEVDKRIKLPNTGVSMLAEVEFGIKFTNWVGDATYNENGIRKVPCTHEIIDVKWDNVSLFAADNPLHAENIPGSWHWDGTYLWVTPPVDETTGHYRLALGDWFWWRQPQTFSIYSTAVIAIGLIRTSTVPRELNDAFYDPRLISAPNLSLRIPSKFGEIAQTGSGVFKFTNVDGFFNEIDRFALAAGRVVLRLGIDKLDAEMAYEDYEVIAIWDIESWMRTDREFSIKVVEPKNKLQTKLPLEFFSFATYNKIEPNWVGRPVPLAYGQIFGVEAIPIDIGLKKFKVAKRAKDLSAVRFSATNIQKNQRVIAASSWQFYSGDVYRYYQPSERTTNVKFNGQSLTSVNSIDDCLSTKGTWVFDENFTYVNPKNGFTISSGTYLIESDLTVKAWVQTNFATKDTANGEFTLGQDWGPGIQVSVDFVGDPDANNGVDIIRSLLLLSGQDNLNEDSFDEARAALRVGTDESGSDVFLFPVGIYINEVTQVDDIITEILRVIRGYTFTDHLGRINIGIFEPKPGDQLQRLTFENVLDFQADTDKIQATAVKVSYNPRRIEGWSESASGESVELQNLNRQNLPVVFEDKENPLTDAESVQFFIDRFLTLDALQLKTYSLPIAWEAMKLLPGDQVLLEVFDELGTSFVAEVLVKNMDLANKRVHLVVGEQRGLYDTAGFWVDDQAKLPEEFLELAGYGTGSLDWNDNWDPIIKRWVKQNVGYWCDDNGFASPTDPESQMISTWV